MFKLKPGNVIQKINKMTRKQAYTWGAIIVVCFVALLTLASFMGEADETSFDDLNTRGYDLAQMPFLNDEAEAYLLASKYPDMQNNGSTLLYSAEEKEARQAEDAANAEEEQTDEQTEEADDSSSVRDDSYSGYSGRGGGYSGYSGRGGGGAGPTRVGQLGSASMERASGSGVNTTFGAPRGDFSPYKSQEKGSEIPTQQLQNQNARKALYQFARGSQAAAGLKEGKGGNAKRALMGGEIKGSEAFTDNGVDLSKSGGLALDTNAPVSSADLSNLQDKVSDAAQKGKEKDDKEEKDFWEKLGEQFLQGLTDIAVQGIGKMVDGGIDAMFANAQGRQARKAATEDMITSLQGLTDISQANDVQKAAIQSLGIDLSKAEPGQSFKDVAAAQLCKGSCSKEVVDMKDMNLTKRYDSDGVEHEMKLGETKTVVDDKALNKALKQQTRGKSNFVVGMNENGTYQTAASVHRTAASEAAGKSWGGHMNIGSTIPQNNDKDRAFKNEDDARKWAKDNGLSDDQTEALIDRQRF